MSFDALSRSLPGEFEEPTTFPRVPSTLQQTGLSEDAVTDLVLKTLYMQGGRTGLQIASLIALPFELLDGVLLNLQQRRLVEVRGAAGLNRASFTFDASGA